MRSLASALVFCALPSALASASTLVFGPGSLELRLITAKLIAREPGCSAALYVGDEPKAAKKCRRLMYGSDYAEADVDAPENAQVLSSVEELGKTLASATKLCLVCDSAPLSDGAFNTLLTNAPGLERVVLLSKMGVTRAKPGPFGLPNPDVALFKNEEDVRSAAAARGIETSVVRVGSLKGGGPGEIADGALVGPIELGLSKTYYDGIAELSTYMTTQSYDRFTLGAKLAAGDPIDLPNALLLAARQASFEPRDDETSRVIAGQAVVHALCRHPTAVDMSVSSAAGEAAPTPDEWTELFAKL